MANEVFGYRKLIAYQKGKEVVKRTYQLLKKFPAEERYAMCDQLRRASVSISSNIAEELGYVSSEDRLSMDMLIEEEARLLPGLLNSYKPSTDSKH